MAKKSVKGVVPLERGTIPASQKKTEKALELVAQEVYDTLMASKVPAIHIPSRTKQNLVFHPRLHVYKYGTAQSAKSAKTKAGAYGILRSMYMIEFIQKMIHENKSSTLREMYYISEGWDLGKFDTQDESNNVAEDLEIITKAMREDFKLRPEENGASVLGNLTIVERNRKGDLKTINCRDDVGDSGYALPYNVEKDKIQIKDYDAKFIMALETGGMYDRLIENRFDEKHDAILVHLKGQPARSTRRFIKRLNEECKLPVVCFTDGDPWSFRIFASVAYGAIKTAHISEYLATPTAQFLGVTPSDIVNYDLPADKLNDQDIRALKAELTDPRFKDSFWHDEIQLQLQLGKKAEQQALAKYGLDYVTDTYLPEKLQAMGVI